MEKYESDPANWGPMRAAYSHGKLPHYAVFNSIIDHPELGNECQFVKIAEVGHPYTDTITLEIGKQYEVCIYYHNNADKEYNSKANYQRGIARNVKVSVSLPEILKSGEGGFIRATIMSDTTVPVSVWSEVLLKASGNMRIQCMENSIRIQTYEELWKVNGMKLPREELFSKEGTLLGVTKLDGTIRGGEKYAGKLLFTVETQELGTFLSDIDYQKKGINTSDKTKSKDEIGYEEEDEEEVVEWNQLSVTQKEFVQPVSNSFNVLTQKEKLYLKQQKDSNNDYAIEMFTNGINYECGKNGLKVDLLKAAEYYLKAAEEGYFEIWPRELR